MIQPSLSVYLLVFLAILAAPFSFAAEVLTPAYYWRSAPVRDGKDTQPTAQLLTLFCSGCGPGPENGPDLPLLSVLRDTLGDDNPSNNKLTAVWLLSYSHPTLGQKAQAAVPFFYWRLSEGSPHVGKKDTAPLLDLSAPEHPAATNVGRQLLQWTALDTFDTPVRATSRAYRTDQVDNERLHLEEANTYLLHAPTTGGPDALTKEERDSVMERLELRKNLLGGFVAANRVAALGQHALYQQEEIRSRNWELLRQCAEKTGLLFEPVSIGVSRNEYGMLWYRAQVEGEPAGSDLRAIWKLLNLKDPYTDDRLANWDGLTEQRALDENGALLPQGQSGAEEVTLIPLGIYSLTYVRQPLLMIDFRDNRHLRRHELLQQTINELTAGVIGVSHFTNWYYFLGADLYNFYQGRHGKATSRAERLDCYAQFRTAISLDRELDAGLREEMQQGVSSLSINPLEASPQKEMAAAMNRYAWLSEQASGDDNRLLKRLDNQRREELASFGETPKRQGMDVALHAMTLGRYTQRAKVNDGNLALLCTYRRAEYQLAFLDRLVSSGTAPEVSYQEASIRSSVSQLSDLIPQIQSAVIRTHVRDTLDRLGKLSNNDMLRADCERALLAVRSGDAPHLGSVPGIVAAPVVTNFGNHSPAAIPIPEEFK